MIKKKKKCLVDNRWKQFRSLERITSPLIPGDLMALQTGFLQARTDSSGSLLGPVHGWPQLGLLQGQTGSGTNSDFPHRAGQS